MIRDDAFAIERTAVRGVEIAYIREGAGGFPLVLLHGWPEAGPARHGVKAAGRRAR